MRLSDPYLTSGSGCGLAYRLKVKEIVSGAGDWARTRAPRQRLAECLAQRRTSVRLRRVDV